MALLQQIDLSVNHLTVLPNSISGLVSLSDLNLTQNYLDSLPDEVGTFKDLCNILATNFDSITELIF